VPGLCIEQSLIVLRNIFYRKRDLVLELGVHERCCKLSVFIKPKRYLNDAGETALP
jgi:hypothetical protein